MNLGGHHTRHGAGARARRPWPHRQRWPSESVAGRLPCGRSSMATERGSMGEKLRRTPTWRAKCWISGSSKTLKVQTLGCARSSFPPTDLRPSSLRSRGRTRSTHNTERHEIYTGSGHRCGVILYSSVWQWIATWADDEQYKGKNSILRLRCSCVGRTCVCVWIRSAQAQLPSTVVARSIYRGPGPLPKY